MRHQVRLSASSTRYPCVAVAAPLRITRASLVSTSGSQQQMSVLQKTIFSVWVLCVQP